MKNILMSTIVILLSGQIVKAGEFCLDGKQPPAEHFYSPAQRDSTDAKVTEKVVSSLSGVDKSADGKLFFVSDIGAKTTGSYVFGNGKKIPLKTGQGVFFRADTEAIAIPKKPIRIGDTNVAFAICSEGFSVASPTDPKKIKRLPSGIHLFDRNGFHIKDVTTKNKKFQEVMENSIDSNLGLESCAFAEDGTLTVALEANTAPNPNYKKQDEVSLAGKNIIAQDSKTGEASSTVFSGVLTETGDFNTEEPVQFKIGKPLTPDRAPWGPNHILRHLQKKPDGSPIFEDIGFTDLKILANGDRLFLIRQHMDSYSMTEEEVKQFGKFHWKVVRYDKKGNIVADDNWKAGNNMEDLLVLSENPLRIQVWEDDNECNDDSTKLRGTKCHTESAILTYQKDGCKKSGK